MVKVCHDLREHLPVDSRYRKELLQLIRTAERENVTISAGGCFEVNRIIFFGIFNVTATYFIIVIQFYLDQQ